MAKGSGGESKQSGQVVQSNTPWSGQQPYLQDIYKQAQGANNQVDRSPWTGELIAKPSGSQQQTNQLAYNTGQQNYGGGTNLANFGLAQTYEQFAKPLQQQVGSGGPLTGMNQTFLNPAANPNLMPALESNINLMAQRAREELFPQIGSAAWKSGAYGGTAHGTALARSARDVTDAAANQTANALSNAWAQAYGTERGIEAGQQSQLSSQQAARDAMLLQLAPQLAQQGLGIQGAGLQTQQAAGQTEQGWRQDLINEALGLRQDARTSPFAGLSDYAALIGGVIPGTSTQTSYSPTPSTFGNFLGGALGGGTLGYGLGSAVGMANPWLGALAGGFAGGLGGIL